MLTFAKGQKTKDNISLGWFTWINWVQLVIDFIDHGHQLTSFFTYRVTSVCFFLISDCFKEQNENMPHPKKERINSVQQIKPSPRQ